MISMTGLRGTVNNLRRSTLSVVVVGVGRTYFAVGIGLVIETPLRFRLALLVLLTVAAQTRKRHRFEPLLGDLQSARLAHAVAAVVEPRERVVDLLELDAFAVRQDDVDLAIALLGRKVVGVHALVLVALAFGAQLGVDLAEQFVLRFEQLFARFDKELTAVRGNWFLGH